jgi:hypothetical protein
MMESIPERPNSIAYFVSMDRGVKGKPYKVLETIANFSDAI